MAKRKFVKRRKLFKRGRSGGFRKFNRSLKRFTKRKQGSNWRVPRKLLAAKNTFIRVRTQFHLPLANANNVAFADLSLLANGLEPVNSVAQGYQSPPLWELATLYQYFHVWKSKVRCEFIDKTNSVDGLDTLPPIHKIAYCFPSHEKQSEITDANFWGWRIAANAKFNNPASIPGCHYKTYTTHQFIYGGKAACVVKHNMKTKKVWAYPVDEDNYGGSFVAGGTVGIASGQVLTVVEPVKKWYWHIGIINVDGTEVALPGGSGELVNADVLITLDTYVRLYGPRQFTQLSETNT